MKDFNWKKEWEYWKPLLQTKGKWSEKKIKNEMHDLVFIFEQVGYIYMELTGGMLSKPMYYADTIIQMHEEAINKAWQEGYDEAKSDLEENTKKE